MKKISCINFIRCLLLGMVSFLLGYSPTMAMQTSHASKTKEHPMSLAYKTETESPVIPAIDVAAPPIFETASFGLG